ncbi:MAG TPA: PIG-L family deacetylase, partial [Thermoanaerobaculia bacterium]|nr:PIG-L family deacetylase [Thermoanaerobaculia bacterium]
MWILVTLLATVMLHPAHGGPLSHYPHLESARPHDRVLIVAPHIDDESIGAGGYAIDAIADGAEVYVVFMTAGDCNRFSARLMYKTLDPTAATYLSVGRARITEAQQAMQLLGVPR